MPLKRRWTKKIKRSRKQSRKQSPKKTYRLKKKLRGGHPIAAGADTCVIQPIVACTDRSHQPYVNGPYVSRIVPEGSTDAIIEITLQENFQGLVNSGRLAVGQNFCTPQFVAGDLQIPANLATRNLNACRALRAGNANNYMNIITLEFNRSSLNNYAQQNRGNISFRDALRILKGAMNAAVGLVPDNGPWAIHVDCHYGNILLRQPTNLSPIESAIGDWGRFIYISHPSNYESVMGSFTEFMKLMKAKGLVRNNTTIENFFSRFNERNGGYPQHPSVILNICQQYIRHMLAWRGRNPSDLANILFPGSSYLKALRGWTAYAILHQLTISFGLVDNSDLNVLLWCKSQRELKEVINKIIYPYIPNNERPYIDIHIGTTESNDDYTLDNTGQRKYITAAVTPLNNFAGLSVQVGNFTTIGSAPGNT